MSETVHYDEAATLPGKADDPYVYGLRTCGAGMTAYNGFVWPKEGWVEAPDWMPAPICGGGLHFLRDGEGDIALLNSVPDAVWMVVRALSDETVDIDGAKSKARRCEVVFAGSRPEAVSLLRSIVGTGKRIPFVCEEAGDSSTQTAGYSSTQTAGYRSTQTAGYRSTQTAGNSSTQTAGDRSTQQGGEGSVFISRWWDDEQDRWRVSVAIVGMDGTLKPDTPYRCEGGVWTEVSEAEGGDA